MDLGPGRWRRSPPARLITSRHDGPPEELHRSSGTRCGVAIRRGAKATPRVPCPESDADPAVKTDAYPPSLSGARSVPRFPAGIAPDASYDRRHVPQGPDGVGSLHRTHDSTLIWPGLEASWSTCCVGRTRSTSQSRRGVVICIRCKVGPSSCVRGTESTNRGRIGEAGAAPADPRSQRPMWSRRSRSLEPANPPTR